MKFNKILLLLFLIVTLSCSHNNGRTDDNLLFKRLSEKESGIGFVNRLTENDSVNYFNYGYMYMGGGVAIGDVNNDGLEDVYFTGNMVKNKLYLNKGGLKFEDISKTAKIEGGEEWTTGVTMVDINADGWLDIYVSVSGIWTTTKNILYLNKGVDSNGVPVFENVAETFGIADEGNSVQATFFDYDNDEDLDLYVINYPVTHFKTTVPQYSRMMKKVTDLQSNTLYRNNGNNTFTDVTDETGLKSFGLSLSAAIGDYNSDGWMDIYVSNDFASPDNFYINNKDGSFTDRVSQTVNQTAFFGMGSDVADFNNDGLLDLFQLDMTPEDNRRSKANMQSMNVEMFEQMKEYEFHTQYMQNALQLNMGNSAANVPRFSNIPRLAGVSLTDWSWGTLLADFDNDGLKDIFVTNGVRREINNKDFFKSGNDKYSLADTKKLDLVSIIEEIPSEKIANYAFKNNGDLTFKNTSEEWGLDHKGFSNGTAYADLDNDGDLDLVINNLDETSFIYENTLDKKQNKYLQLYIEGASQNPKGIGIKVFIFHKGKKQFQELQNSRGFQSSVSFKLHYGVGNIEYIDSIAIEWPDAKTQKLYNVKTNQKLLLNYKAGIKFTDSHKSNHSEKFFENINQRSGIDFKHHENNFDDY
ncbi:MAG: CRTAC1 family protein, partial [Allomuricauda sp.]